MSLSSNVSALAVRVAEEFNTVRDEVAGKADAEHQHSAADITSGTLDIGRIPTGSSSSTVALGNHNHSGVYAPASHSHTANDLIPRPGTSASSIDADSVDIVDLTMNGDVTLSVPTNGFNGKTIQVTALANGDDRTLTFNTSFKRLDGIDESYVIPEGQYLRAAIRRTGSTWIVEAVGVTT